MATRTITISSSPTTITIPAESSREIDYIISGSHAMAGAIVIAAGGDLTNKKFTFYYTASLTSYSTGANYLQFPSGDKLPAELAAKECIITCIYNGSAWKCWMTPDFTESQIVSSSNIVDGTIVAGDLASDAVITAKVLDSNITLAKIEDIADGTILGNVSGGAAVPDQLTPTEVRTLLDQDVTLTGEVTGTATQTFATGITTVSTTVASAVIDADNLTTATKTETITIPISFESGALTAGQGYFGYKAGYDFDVIDYSVMVVELIEATDDATVTLYNNAGSLMGSSSVTVTKNTKPATGAPPAGSTFNSSTITSNNSIAQGDMMSVRCQKTTAGGKAFVEARVRRT